MDLFNALISAENNQELYILKSAEAFQQFLPCVHHCSSVGLVFIVSAQTS